jgi:predicted SnoaL-like aldol condensation-catalyzing enzyme
LLIPFVRDLVTAPIPKSDSDRKSIALEFFQRLRVADRAGAERLVTPRARHHNPYFAAGMPALIAGAAGAAETAPDRTMEVLRVVADGDLVVVHSHVRPRPDEPGMSVVHIFRFDGDRIAELWDVGQAVPAENANADGMF